jgi:hypothetical protein
MSGSDYTRTPNLQLYKPIYDMDDGAWGGHLNYNADVIDGLLGGLTPGPFLPLAGGTLSGALQLPSGTLAAPSLAFGAADGTGWSRNVNALSLGIQGTMTFAAFAGSAQFYGQLSMLNNRITLVADATAAGDAMNQRSGDARYLQLVGTTTLTNAANDAAAAAAGVAVGSLYRNGSIVMQRIT